MSIYIYRSNALARRMRDRELEIQSDARDKQREMEEIEEILRKQMAGESVEPKTKRHPVTGATSGFMPHHNHQIKENEVCLRAINKECVFELFCHLFFFPYRP